MEGGRKRKRGREAGKCFQLTAFLESQPGVALHLWHCLFFYVISFSEAQISLIKMILEIVPDSCHLKTQFLCKYEKMKKKEKVILFKKNSRYQFKSSYLGISRLISLAHIHYYCNCTYLSVIEIRRLFLKLWPLCVQIALQEITHTTSACKYFIRDGNGSSFIDMLQLVMVISSDFRGI